jgi:hypothetical protein
MNTCCIDGCGAAATHACTHCARFCCEGHVTSSHAIRYAGVVCTECASTSWKTLVVCLVGFAFLAGVVYFTVIRPLDAERDAKSKAHQQRMEHMRKEHERIEREFDERRKGW